MASRLVRASWIENSMRISKNMFKVGRGLQEPRGLKFLTTESIVFMKVEACKSLVIG